LVKRAYHGGFVGLRGLHGNKPASTVNRKLLTGYVQTNPCPLRVYPYTTRAGLPRFSCTFRDSSYPQICRSAMTRPPRRALEPSRALLVGVVAVLAVVSGVSHLSGCYDPLGACVECCEERLEKKGIEESESRCDSACRSAQGEALRQDCDNSWGSYHTCVADNDCVSAPCAERKTRLDACLAKGQNGSGGSTSSSSSSGTSSFSGPITSSAGGGFGGNTGGGFGGGTGGN